jgi:FkbM family methyltransferase
MKFIKILKLKLKKYISFQCLNRPPVKIVSADYLISSNSMIRLGTTYGGWYIPKNHGLSQESVCYLAGAGEDISFDCAVAENFGCSVRIIDPTPKAIAHFKGLTEAINNQIKFPVNNSKIDFYDISETDIKKITFLPYGLSDQDCEIKFYFPKNPDHVSCSALNIQKTNKYFIAQCFKLSSLMGQLEDSKVDLLKMDIEGAEYSVIRDMVSSNLLPRILLIEFDELHTPLDDDAPARIKQHVDMLNQSGMKCVFIDGCNLTFAKE